MPVTTRAASGQQPRVVTFAAAEVEADETFDVGEHRQEGGGVEGVPVSVEAGPR